MSPAETAPTTDTMDQSSLPLAAVEQHGRAYRFGHGPFADAFVVRIRRATGGSITIPGSGGHLVGFGAVCTHMGCLLVPEDAEDWRLDYGHSAAPPHESLVCGPCPCHGTSFDLLRAGLVVLGPATQNLPQLELNLTPDLQSVVAVNWLASPVQNGDPRSERWPM